MASELRLNPLTCAANALFVMAVSSIILSNPDISEAPCICPYNATFVPPTVMADAETAPMFKFADDVTFKSLNVAVDAVTTLNYPVVFSIPDSVIPDKVDVRPSTSAKE